MYANKVHLLTIFKSSNSFGERHFLSSYDLFKQISHFLFISFFSMIFFFLDKVCERSDEVDCSASEQYYHLNLDLFGRHGLIL